MGFVVFCRTFSFLLVVVSCAFSRNPYFYPFVVLTHPRHLDGYGLKILFNHGVRRFMTRQNSRDAWLPELARLCQVLSSAFFVSNCWLKNAMR